MRNIEEIKKRAREILNTLTLDQKLGQLNMISINPDLDQIKIPDPVSMQLCTLSVHIKNLEKHMHFLNLSVTEENSFFCRI